MCTNFIPTAADMLVQFGVEQAPFEYKVEAYPGCDVAGDQRIHKLSVKCRKR
ncbi:MAG: hypothetical protein ABI905_16340 [Betaproteobacteria bacterium]